MARNCVAQQIGTPEARAHAAQSERRVVLGGHRQVVDRLVAACIERADREWLPLETIRDPLVDLELLVLRGWRARGRGTGIRYAAARSPRLRAPRRHSSRPASRGSRTRGCVDRRACGRHAWPQGVAPRAGRVPRRQTRSAGGQRLRVGCDVQFSRKRVQDHIPAFRHRVDWVARRDEHRQANGTRHDRDVRGGTTARRCRDPPVVPYRVPRIATAGFLAPAQSRAQAARRSRGRGSNPRAASTCASRSRRSAARSRR